MYYYQPSIESYFDHFSYERKRNDIPVTTRFFPLEEAYEKGNIVREEYDPYKDYKTLLPVGKNDRENLLLLMMIYGGVLHDLVLILDIYPQDKSALTLFHAYNEKYKEIWKSYNEKYDSLSAASSYDKDGMFSYVRTASPWLKM